MVKDGTQTFAGVNAIVYTDTELYFYTPETMSLTSQLNNNKHRDKFIIISYGSNRKLIQQLTLKITMYNKEAKVWKKDGVKSPRNLRQSFSTKAFSVTIN